MSGTMEAFFLVTALAMPRGATSTRSWWQNKQIEQGDFRLR